MIDLSLPAAYHAIRLAGEQSPAAAARKAADAGAAEGALFWCDRTDRFDAALLLRPDRARRETLPVVFVAALAFADALGAFAPPQVPISFRWPGDILIDGAVAGRISIDCAAGEDNAVPAWMVLILALAVTGGRGEPGHALSRTSIAEEGFEDFTPAAQLEGFSRHFLLWLDRWEREGFAAIAAEWWRRATGFAARLEIATGDGRAADALGLDAFGNLRIADPRAAGERILPLAAELAGHSPK